MSEGKAYVIEGFESKCIQDKCFDRSLASFKKEKGSPSGFMLRHMYRGVFWGHVHHLCFCEKTLCRKRSQSQRKSRGKDEK